MTMNTRAKVRFGSQLKMEHPPGSHTFNKVAEVKKVSGPGFKRDTPEATNHDSPEMWREFIKGLKDGDVLSATINYLFDDEPSHSQTTGLLADFADDETIRQWKWVANDVRRTTLLFYGILNSFNRTDPEDNPGEASIGIKISGKPVLTTGG